MLTAIVAILAGLVLLADLFHGTAQRMIGNLRPYEVVIGVAAVVLGILQLLSLLGIALLLAGLILAVSALQSIPSIGDELARAARALAPVRTLIGIVVLVLGVLALL
jgi:hypothetical protein